MIYEGKAKPQGGPCDVTVHGEPLNPRHDLRNHSPDGFQWGYGGSGPAQLALAILAHHTGNPNVAQAHYQNFKWKVIARWPADRDLAITGDDVEHFLAAVEAEEGGL